MSSKVTILILIDGFLQYEFRAFPNGEHDVTILILIDGFLQYQSLLTIYLTKKCHNPYFNRWFSTIWYKANPVGDWTCHNPYFNRWFSAIQKTYNQVATMPLSQSLF